MKNKIFIKTISITIAIFLLLTTSINDFAYAISVTPVTQTAINSDLLKDFNINNNVISYNLGKITSAINCNSDTVVVNIQDFHCNPFVQKNISDIISVFAKQYNVKSVYVEGGYGNIDTKWLSEIKDENIRTQLIKVLLENGSLTGAEYFSATNPLVNINIYGIEKESVYKENFRRLQNIFSNKKKYEQIIKIFEKDLNFLQNKYFNKGNKKFNNILKKYRNGQIETRKFYKILFRYVQKYKNPSNDIYGTLLPIRLEDYPNIYTYIILGEYEKNIKSTKITVELKKILAALKTCIPYEQYSQIIKNSNNLKDIPELVSILNALPKEFKTANFSPEMKNFINYVEISKQINPVKLVEEERILVENIRLALSNNEAEIDISFISDFFNYFIDYLNTSITASNYKYFSSKFDKFKILWDKYTYYNQLNNYKNEFDILDAYYKTNVQRDYLFLENIKQHIELKSGDIGKIDNNYSNILKSAKNIILVVTGGFHTEGLKNIITENKISYMVITPNVKGNVDFANNRYEQLVKMPIQNFAEQAFQLPLLSNGDGTRINEIICEGLESLNIEPTQENIEFLNITANKIISELTGRPTRYNNIFKKDENGIRINRFSEIQNVIRIALKENIKFINPKNYIDETLWMMTKFASDSKGEIWEISQLPSEIKDYLKDIGYSEYMPEFLQRAYYNIGEEYLFNDTNLQEYEFSFDKCPFMIKLPNGKVVIILAEKKVDRGTLVSEKYYIIDENFSWDTPTVIGIQSEQYVANYDNNSESKKHIITKNRITQNDINNVQSKVVEYLEDYAKDNNGNPTIRSKGKKDDKNKNRIFISATKDVKFININEPSNDLQLYDNDSSYAQKQMDSDLISLLNDGLINNNRNDKYTENSNMRNASEIEIEDVKELNHNQVVFICLQDFTDAKSDKKKRIEEYIKYAIKNNKPIIIYPNIYVNDDELSNADLKFLFKILGDHFVSFADSYISTIIESMGLQNTNYTNDLREELSYSLKEILKNAFVHGNLSELNKPIVINFDTDEHQINVLNLNTNKEENIYRKLITFTTDLRGYGKGIFEINRRFNNLYNKYPKVTEDKWQYVDNFEDKNRTISCASLQIKDNSIMYEGNINEPFIFKISNDMFFIKYLTDPFSKKSVYKILAKNNENTMFKSEYFDKLDYKTKTALKKELRYGLIEMIKNAIVHGNHLDLSKPITLEFDKENFQINILNEFSKAETNSILQHFSVIAKLSGFQFGIEKMSDKDKTFVYSDNFQEGKRTVSQASLKLDDIKYKKLLLSKIQMDSNSADYLIKRDFIDENCINSLLNNNKAEFLINLSKNIEKELKRNEYEFESIENINFVIEKKDKNEGRTFFSLKPMYISYGEYKLGISAINGDYYDSTNQPDLTLEDLLYSEDGSNVIENIYVFDRRDYIEYEKEYSEKLKSSPTVEKVLDMKDINKINEDKQNVSVYTLDSFVKDKEQFVSNLFSDLQQGKIIALYPCPSQSTSIKDSIFMYKYLNRIFFVELSNMLAQELKNSSDLELTNNFSIAIHETLKNAFVHGNNLADKPIFLSIQGDKLCVSNIVDKKTKLDNKKKISAVLANLTGVHSGNNFIKAFMPQTNYEHSDINKLKSGDVYEASLTIGDIKNVVHRNIYEGKSDNIKNIELMIELPDNGKYNSKYVYIKPADKAKRKLAVIVVDNEYKLSKEENEKLYLNKLNTETLQKYGIKEFKDDGHSFKIELEKDVKLVNLSDKYIKEDKKDKDKILKFEKNSRNKKDKQKQLMTQANKNNRDFLEKAGIKDKEVVDIANVDLSDVENSEQYNIVFNLQDLYIKNTGNKRKELIVKNIKYCVERNIPVIMYPCLNNTENMDYSDLKMFFDIVKGKLGDFCRNYYGEALAEHWKTENEFKKYIGICLLEMLKNAIVHGNNADLSLPIVIKPAKDKIEIINDNTQNKQIENNKKINLTWKFFSAVSGLHGRGLGIESMKNFRDMMIYSDNNIKKTENNDLWVASIEKNKEFVDLYFEEDIDNETINTDDKSSDIIYKGAFDNFFVIDVPGKEPVFARFHRGSFNTTDYIIEAKGGKINKNLEKLQFGQYGLKLEKSSDGKEITLTKDKNYKEGTNVISIPVRYDDLNKKSNLSSKEIEKQNETNKQFFDDLNINISNKDEYEIIHLQDLSSDLENKIRTAVNNGKPLIVYPYLYDDFKVAMQNKDYAKLYFLFKELGNDIHLLDFTNTYADIVTNNFFDEFNLNLKISIKEVLKNSIVHGNNMDLSLPIVIKFDKENSQIDIFNQNIKEEPNKILQTIVVAADWAGFGEGIKRMQSFNTLEYSDNNNNGKRKSNDKIWQTTLKKKKDTLKEIKNKMLSKIDVDDEIAEYLIDNVITISNENLLNILEKDESEILKMLIDELEKAAFNLQRLPSKMNVIKNINLIVEKSDGTTIVLTLFDNRLTIYAQNGDFVNYKYLDGQMENDLIENVKNIHIARIDDEGYDYYKEQYENEIKENENKHVDITLQQYYPNAKTIGKMYFNEADLTTLSLDEFVTSRKNFKRNLFESLQKGKLVALFPSSMHEQKTEISTTESIFRCKYINNEFFREISFYLAEQTRENSNIPFTADYGYDILEIFKNAFVHGNNLSLDKPIFVYIRDGRLYITNVVDKKNTSNYQKSLAVLANLTGVHAGHIFVKDHVQLEYDYSDISELDTGDIYKASIKVENIDNTNKQFLENSGIKLHENVVDIADIHLESSDVKDNVVLNLEKIDTGNREQRYKIEKNIKYCLQKDIPIIIYPYLNKNFENLDYVTLESLFKVTGIKLRAFCNFYSESISENWNANYEDFNFSFFETMKNAIVHGNNANLSLPIVIKSKKEESKIEIINNNIPNRTVMDNTKINPLWKSLAADQKWHGQGLGIKSMDSLKTIEYSDNNITNTTDKDLWIASIILKGNNTNKQEKNDNSISNTEIKNFDKEYEDFFLSKINNVNAKKITNNVIKNNCETYLKKDIDKLPFNKEDITIFGLDSLYLDNIDTPDNRDFIKNVFENLQLGKTVALYPQFLFLKMKTSYGENYENIPSQNLELLYKKNNELFYKLSEELAEYIKDAYDANISKKEVSMAIYEILKNAFVHGNNLSFNKPIFLYINNGKLCISNLVDKAHIASNNELSAAVEAGLTGVNSGNNIISELRSIEYTYPNINELNTGNIYEASIKVKNVSKNNEQSKTTIKDSNIPEIYEPLLNEISMLFVLKTISDAIISMFSTSVTTQYYINYEFINDIKDVINKNKEDNDNGILTVKIVNKNIDEDININKIKLTNSGLKVNGEIVWISRNNSELLVYCKGQNYEEILPIAKNISLRTKNINNTTDFCIDTRENAPKITEIAGVTTINSLFYSELKENKISDTEIASAIKETNIMEQKTNMFYSVSKGIPLFLEYEIKNDTSYNNFINEVLDENLGFGYVINIESIDDNLKNELKKAKQNGNLIYVRCSADITQEQIKEMELFASGYIDKIDNIHSFDDSQKDITFTKIDNFNAIEELENKIRQSKNIPLISATELLILVNKERFTDKFSMLNKLTKSLFAKREYNEDFVKDLASTADEKLLKEISNYDIGQILNSLKQNNLNSVLNIISQSPTVNIIFKKIERNAPNTAEQLKMEFAKKIAVRVMLYSLAGNKILQKEHKNILKNAENLFIYVLEEDEQFNRIYVKDNNLMFDDSAEGIIDEIKEEHGSKYLGILMENYDAITKLEYILKVVIDDNIELNKEKKEFNSTLEIKALLSAA